MEAQLLEKHIYQKKSLTLFQTAHGILIPIHSNNRDYDVVLNFDDQANVHRIASLCARQDLEIYLTGSVSRGVYGHLHPNTYESIEILCVTDNEINRENTRKSIIKRKNILRRGIRQFRVDDNTRWPLENHSTNCVNYCFELEPIRMWGDFFTRSYPKKISLTLMSKQRFEGI